MNIKTKKLVGWLVGAAIVLGAGYFGFKALDANAATPSQYGLQEGDLIRASGDNDIFIVNEYGYKRLFLNPAIFNMYGHLGGWANVKTVTPSVRDAFVTSPYFRADGDTKVYKLEVSGEDTGVLRWVNMSQADFLATANVNQIFTINGTELAWYPKGSDVVVGSQVNSAVAVNVEGTTVTRNAQALKVMSVNFNGNGSVSSLNVVKSGIFAAGNNEVYLSVNGKRISDPTNFDGNGVAKFTNLNLTAPFTVDVMANLDAQGGEVVQVKLDGSYNGLPLTSSKFTVASALSGTVAVTVGNDDYASAFVGQSNVKVGHFKFTAPSDEGFTLNSLQVRNTGNNSIDNVKLVVDGKTYSSVYSGDNYYLFTGLNTVVLKNKSVTAYLYVDVKSSANNTPGLEFRIEKPYDVMAVSSFYNFGMESSGTGVASKIGDSGDTLGSNGSLTVSSVTNDKVLALWEDTEKTLFQFKVKPKDESFTLNELGFNVNDDVVKKIYVYSGSTLVGSESVDSNVASVSTNFVVSAETVFTVKADFENQDVLASASFTPSLASVKATGVGSNEDITVSGVTGSNVYVYSAYPVVTRTDAFSSSLPLAIVDVLKLSVKAVGDDIKLASASAPFTFTVSSYGMPNNLPYTVIVGGVEYGSGNLASTSATFAPLVSYNGDELFIAEDSTKEITFRFNFSGSDANRGFKLTIPNSTASVKWFAENEDGDFVQLNSEVDMFGFPIESTQFYRETN